MDREAQGLSPWEFCIPLQREEREEVFVPKTEILGPRSQIVRLCLAAWGRVAFRDVGSARRAEGVVGLTDGRAHPFPQQFPGVGTQIRGPNTRGKASGSHGEERVSSSG